MIEINLIPPDMRRKSRGRQLLGGLNLPLEVIIGLGGGLVMILVLVHIALFVITIGKMKQHKSLSQEWEEITPAKEQADSVIQEMRALQAKLNDIREVTGQTDPILWSRKLNILSDQLSRGVWLQKIALTEEMFFIEGSAISRDHEEMINVHQFTTQLKNSDQFLDGFEDLELGSIQRRMIKQVEIADFIISMQLEQDTEEETQPGAAP